MVSNQRVYSRQPLQLPKLRLHHFLRHHFQYALTYCVLDEKNCTQIQEKM